MTDLGLIMQGKCIFFLPRIERIYIPRACPSFDGLNGFLRIDFSHGLNGCNGFLCVWIILRVVGWVSVNFIEIYVKKYNFAKSSLQFEKIIVILCAL